jgi:hypothetical protein
VQKKFRPALIIALILYGLETILTIFNGLVTGIIVRVIFLVYLARGLGALKELRAKEQAPGLNRE